MIFFFGKHVPIIQKIKNQIYFRYTPSVEERQETKTIYNITTTATTHTVQSYSLVCQNMVLWKNK